MAKEVKLRMTLDEKGAVQSVDKVGERFRRTKKYGRDAGEAGHAGFMKIAAGAAAALGAIQLVQGGYRVMKGLIVDSVIETAKLQDETAKFSHQLGVDTETLSAYRHVLRLTGVTFEALETALETVSMNAYDFTNDTGAAKEAFEELGISVTDGNGILKTSEELLLDTAEKMMLLESETRKSALAQLIFGGTGAQLLPMLEKGRAGIEAMKEEAKALGLTFSDETARRSEEFNNSLTRLTGAFNGIKMQVGEEVIPVLTDLSDWLVENDDLMDNLTVAAKQFGVGVVSSVSLIAKALENWYGTIVPFWEKTFFLLSTGVETMENMAKYGTFKGFLISSLTLGPKVEELEKNLAAGKKTAAVWGDIAWQVQQALVKANLGISTTAAKTENTLSSLNSWNKTLLNSSLSTLAEWDEAYLASSLREFLETEGLPPVKMPASTIGMSYEEVRAEAERRKAAAEQATFGLGQINLLPGSPEIQTEGAQYFGLTDEKVQNTVNALDLMREAAAEMGNAGAQAFGQWAMGSGSFGVALRRATVQVLANLATQNLAYAITETAHGFAALAWGNFPKAAAHFKAAALYGSVAGLQGGGARLFSGGEGGQGPAGSAFNPVYTQPSYQNQNQQIIMEQGSAITEFKEILGVLKTQPAGVLVKDGVTQNGGVMVLMNDRDRSEMSSEVLQSRIARG